MDNTDTFLPVSVLYEDAWLFVVNKPPGMVVNRAESVKTFTLQDWIAKERPFSKEIPILPEHADFYARNGFVHRIDKETSGCLLVAKDPTTFTALTELFASRNVHKIYRSIVHGAMTPREGEIRAPVGRLPWNKERFGIVPGGKESVTTYKVIGEPFLRDKEKYTYVEWYPFTGRTHQIRVHAKYINHPLVGDYLYAGRKVSRADRSWASRVMLHAFSIRFQHPRTGAEVIVTAPIPQDMASLLPSSVYNGGEDSV